MGKHLAGNTPLYARPTKLSRSRVQVILPEPVKPSPLGVAEMQTFAQHVQEVELYNQTTMTDCKLTMQELIKNRFANIYSNHVKVGGSLVSRLVSVDRVYSTEVHEV